jgi:hypothetical protein
MLMQKKPKIQVFLKKGQYPRVRKRLVQVIAIIKSSVSHKPLRTSPPSFKRGLSICAPLTAPNSAQKTLAKMPKRRTKLQILEFAPFAHMLLLIMHRRPLFVQMWLHYAYSCTAEKARSWSKNSGWLQNRPRVRR